MHMAYSASLLPTRGQNPRRVNVDVEDVNVLSFGSSGYLRKDKNYSFFSDSSSHSCYSSLSSTPSLEVEEDETHQWFHEDQETLIKSQDMADDYERLFWENLKFDFLDSYSDALHNNGRHESSNSTNTSFCLPPLSYADLHQRYGPVGLYRFDNSKFRDIMNCSGNRSDANNNHLMTSCYERGSEEDHMQKERVLGGYVLLLHKACEDHSLVETVLLESELFIDAAFWKQGASSIIKLIKKLKVEKSHHAFTVTRILSTRFLDITTHPVARIVIQKCFFFFGSQPNEILYEKAMHHFKDLAIQEVGCKSLNDCIDTISGEKRAWLLNQIADVSDYLSNHPYGNYVVQNVLSLRDSQVNAKIVQCLRGQFVHLARKKEGSRVVEKCMESCHLGIIYVVEEILHNPRAPFQLAQHQFGNYVIQKALKKTMRSGFSCIYFGLVRSLEPYWRQLNRTKGGKNVIRVLEKAYSI